MKQGVHYDVAFSLDAPTRLAYLVILGEAEGFQVWDWNALKWREKK